jgi:hypothetical protein
VKNNHHKLFSRSACYIYKLNTVGCDKKIKGLAGPVFNKKGVS